MAFQIKGCDHEKYYFFVVQIYRYYPDPCVYTINFTLLKKPIELQSSKRSHKSSRKNIKLFFASHFGFQVTVSVTWAVIWIRKILGLQDPDP